MDNFGFETQGKNYQNFRPKYPQCLYKYTLNKIKAKNRYLDVAMGTGQLLFNIAPYFDFSKGIDISGKMLESAKSELLEKHSNMKQKIDIQKCDVADIPINQKYNLITVGQALHWFPVRDSLIRMRNILEPEGKLLVLSYIVKGVQTEQKNQIYQKFYEKVKPYFDFDRNQMHNHYSDKEKYPFEQIFPDVVRFAQQVKIPMEKDVYMNYLKTYSGYNQYLLKNSKEQDPIQQIQNQKNETVVVLFDYFKIQCGI